MKATVVVVAFFAFSIRLPVALVAPYGAMLRYYRCDTPYRAILSKGGQQSPKMVRYPPIILSFAQAHLCDTPFCNVSRDNCAIRHNLLKTNTKEFCDTIATSIARYEKYRCSSRWAQTLSRSLSTLRLEPSANWSLPVQHDFLCFHLGM